MRSFTAFTMSCSPPRYLSVVWIEECPSKNWICSRSPPDENVAMRPQGQQEGNYDSDRFQTRTLRYSLRRVSPLDYVNCGTHNPKVGGSNPPPATNLNLLLFSNSTGSLPKLNEN